jgi:hypothetical protein
MHQAVSGGNNQPDPVLCFYSYICRRKPIHLPTGKMAERSNAAVSKTVVRLSADRGFESPSFRNKSKPAKAGFFISKYFKNELPQYTHWIINGFPPPL